MESIWCHPGVHKTARDFFFSSVNESIIIVEYRAITALYSLGILQPCRAIIGSSDAHEMTGRTITHPPPCLADIVAWRKWFPNGSPAISTSFGEACKWMFCWDCVRAIDSFPCHVYPVHCLSLPCQWSLMTHSLPSFMHMQFACVWHMLSWFFPHASLNHFAVFTTMLLQFRHQLFGVLGTLLIAPCCFEKSQKNIAIVRPLLKLAHTSKRYPACIAGFVIVIWFKI